VIGRKSGNTISIPVWFVLEGEKARVFEVLEKKEGRAGGSQDLSSMFR